MSRSGTRTCLVYSGDIPSRRTYRGSNSSTIRRVPHQIWASGCQMWKSWRTFTDRREPKIVPPKAKRALELAQEKGSSIWLTVLPLQEQSFNLTKREFRDAVKLRYDWQCDDISSICACGENFTVDHAMICKRGDFVIQRHYELRDLEAELLNTLCSDVEVEPVLQDITEEQLSR